MVNKKKNNYFFLSNPTTDFSGRARTLWDWLFWQGRGREANRKRREVYKMGRSKVKQCYHSMLSLLGRMLGRARRWRHAFGPGRQVCVRFRKVNWLCLTAAPKGSRKLSVERSLSFWKHCTGNGPAKGKQGFKAMNEAVLRGRWKYSSCGFPNY